MGIITAITDQKKSEKRANIFIDGQYACALDKLTILTFGLKEGLEIDSERLLLLEKDSQEKTAFDKSVKYLCIRMRTISELKKYLADKEYREDVIDCTVNKLKEYGYLNDSEFTKIYIRSYRQKYGNKKLSYELTRLGVEQEIIDNHLDEDIGDEQEACEKVAQKYLKTHKKNISSQKIATYLFSKGFDSSLSRQVAKKYMDMQSAEDSSYCDEDI